MAHLHAHNTHKVLNTRYDFIWNIIVINMFAEKHTACTLNKYLISSSNRNTILVTVCDAKMCTNIHVKHIFKQSKIN